jgi:hypothetical protein
MYSSCFIFYIPEINCIIIAYRNDLEDLVEPYEEIYYINRIDNFLTGNYIYFVYFIIFLHILIEYIIFTRF